MDACVARDGLGAKGRAWPGGTRRAWAGAGAELGQAGQVIKLPAARARHRHLRLHDGDRVEVFNRELLRNRHDMSIPVCFYRQADTDDAVL